VANFAKFCCLGTVVNVVGALLAFFRWGWGEGEWGFVFAGEGALEPVPLLSRA